MASNKKIPISNLSSIIKRYFNKTMALILVFFISTILLTLSFYNNSFEVADISTFRSWQNDSESLVVGRLIQSRQAGLGADYGLLQRDPDWSESNRFITGEHVDNLSVYPSQLGLQGLAFGIIDRFVPLNSSDTLKLLYFMNSLLLAIFIVLVAFWASKQLNLLSGLFIIIGCIFSPWLVFSAKNLYWVLWTMLLPFVTILYLQWLESRSVKINQWIFGLAAFITVFIKTACGFEFISSILISIEIPVIYYAIREKWNIKKYICRSLFIGAGGTLAFITTFCINIWQRTMRTGDFNTAWESMKFNISKRTGFFEMEIAPVYQNSLDQPVLKVIYTYLRDGISLVLDFRMAEMILLLIILTLGLLISQKYINSVKEERNKLAPLVIAAFISLLAPISWLILAKGHSSIHVSINYLLWYFPSVLLILALCGAIISLIFKNVWRKHYNSLQRCFIVICVILISILPIYRYYQAWDWKQNTQQVEQALNDGTSLYKDESFELVYYENALFYKADKSSDVYRSFFLHIIPINIDDLPQDCMEQGYDNRDFAFTNSRIRLPIWKTYYIARVNLPDYEIEQISTGQFSDSTRFWETSVALVD